MKWGTVFRSYAVPMADMGNDRLSNQYGWHHGVLPEYSVVSWPMERDDLEDRTALFSHGADVFLNKLDEISTFFLAQPSKLLVR